MLKIKSVLNLAAIGLLLAGANAYATCVTNTSNSSTSTLNSSTAGDCVENSGTITTSGTNSYGIYSTGASSTNTNSGTISTSGSNGFAIVSTGTSSTNTNSDTITTSGTNGYGIYSTGTTSTNTNSGSITTSGNYGYGIVSSGTSSANTNSGLITTIGNYSYAIYSTGTSSTNTNSDTITTSGTQGFGIRSTGATSTNTNSGTITTSGTNGFAISSTGATSTNTNSGTISTSGTSGYGIYSTGATSTNTNSGLITTIGNYSYAIVSTGTSSTNTNSGTISTSGTQGFGIASSGTSSTNTNSGSITTSGTDSYGIYSTGATSTNTNSGTITTSGVNSIGINVVGSSVTVYNSGSILTTGTGYSPGISSGGNDLVINNYGKISAIGYGVAIELYSNSVSNNVVNLNRGSVIVGDIYAPVGTVGAKLNFHLGAGVSYAYSVTGPWTVTDLDNRPMVTGSAYAAGIGAQETAAQMLYQRTASATSALDRRLRSYASDEVDNQPYWLDVYYSDVSRNSGGNHSTQTAFSNYNYGLSAGFKLPAEVTPLELVINAHQNNLNIDSGAQKIDSTSLIAGVLAPSITDVLGAKLSAKVMVGYAEHDGDRKVMTNSLLYDGSRQIKSNFHSTYLVLGTALTKLHPITDHLTADILLGLDLNTERVESYKESDYFAWDGRTLTQVQSRVQAGLNYAFNENKAIVFARVGAENRNLIGGATQDYEINNTAVSFNTNNKNDTYLTAQVGIKAQLEKRIQLFGVLSTLHSSDSVNSVSGNVGIRADF